MANEETAEKMALPRRPLEVQMWVSPSGVLHTCDTARYWEDGWRWATFVELIEQEED